MGPTREARPATPSLIIVKWLSVLSSCSVSGSWALSMRPFSLYAPEMDEAAIGDAHMRGAATVTLTRVMLAGQPCQPRDQPHRECPRPGFWPYFLLDHWPHTAAVSLDRTALPRSELCGCFPAHGCGSRRDALLSRPIHFTKGWRQLQAPTRRDNSDGAIEFPENGATKRVSGALDEAIFSVPTRDGQDDNRGVTTGRRGPIASSPVILRLSPRDRPSACLIESAGDPQSEQDDRPGYGSSRPRAASRLYRRAYRVVGRV